MQGRQQEGGQSRRRAVDCSGLQRGAGDDDAEKVRAGAANALRQRMSGAASLGAWRDFSLRPKIDQQLARLSSRAEHWQSASQALHRLIRVVASLSNNVCMAGRVVLTVLSQGKLAIYVLACRSTRWYGYIFAAFCSMSRRWARRPMHDRAVYNVPSTMLAAYFEACNNPCSSLSWQTAAKMMCMPE